MKIRDVIRIRSVDILMQTTQKFKFGIKGTVLPITGYEGPEGTVDT